jgi:hypothetical protein
VRIHKSKLAALAYPAAVAPEITAVVINVVKHGRKHLPAGCIQEAVFAVSFDRADAVAYVFADGFVPGGDEQVTLTVYKVALVSKRIISDNNPSFIPDSNAHCGHTPMGSQEEMRTCQQQSRGHEILRDISIAGVEVSDLPEKCCCPSAESCW